MITIKFSPKMLNRFHIAVKLLYYLEKENYKNVEFSDKFLNLKFFY